MLRLSQCAEYPFHYYSEGGWVEKFKTPDSGYEPSFGTGTRMRGYGNVGSNDLHIYLGWPAHLLSS